MERKLRIWLTMLSILLVAALVGVVVVKNKWDGSEASLVSANADLVSHQASVEALSDELASAQLSADELKTQAESLQAESESKSAEIDALSTQLETLAGESELRKSVEQERDQLLAQIDLLSAQNEELIAKSEPSAASSSEPTASASASASPGASAASGNTTSDELDSIVRQIDAIVGTDSSMTDEEKLQALYELELQLKENANSLNAALDQLTEQKSALDEANAAVVELEGSLANANADMTSLQEKIDDGNKVITELEEKIDLANAQIEDGKADSSELETQVGKLTESLDAEKVSVLALKEEFAQVKVNYESLLSELRAYRIEREPGEGESHADNALGESIHFEADGLHGSIELENSITSGNNIALELVLEGATIFTSKTIVPGETLTEILLEQPLASGTYIVVAQIKTYDADGGYLSGQRLPIQLVVAAE